ncbi:Linear gramicidin synthase subunit B [Marinomonas spartinae]|uniref:Linear gramicidin synthase subunit B n=1 Tax=Marinomonas spartinae TaxID=1792290 RepID=A0A1A8T3B5_9GAMM|nr:non-ribosomal peptide synthetase [Marinomonas spartinae]SBS26295.1 Linear gramicidin synthase subunit B [Marinomonas spartinae]
MTAKNDKTALAKRFLQLGEQEQIKFIRLLDGKGLNFETLPIVAGERPKLIPLSPAQKRMWDIYQLDTGNSAYHMGGCFEVSGPLDLKQLQSALLKMMEKHHTLRTRFVQDEAGETFQFIENQPVISIESWDQQDADEHTLQQANEAFLSKPFDLYRGLPIRAQSIRLEEKRYQLHLVMHHLVSDGWSVDIFMGDLIKAYQAITLTPLDIQYADYAIWQTALLKAGKDQEHLDFWRQEIGTHQPEKLFAWQGEVTPNQRRLADSLQLTVSSRQHQALKQIARQLSVTTSSLWLGLWQSALAKASKQQTISIGIPLANRQRAEVANVIGFFVNTLVIKQTIAPSSPLMDSIQTAHQKVLQAQDHQLVPFDQIVASLLTERAPGETPFFQVLFNHQMVAQTSAQLSPEVTIKPIHQSGLFALFDVALDIREHADHTRVILTYAKDRIAQQAMTQLFPMLERLTDTLEENLPLPLARINLLSEGDIKRLNTLAQPNGSWQFAPITSLIAKQAVVRPNAIALKQSGAQYTFAELESQSNQLAHYLIGLGIRQDEPVGVLFERGGNMIIAMIAIMKAGGAFLPLDPDYPTERLAYMIEDSGAKYLLSHQTLTTRWHQINRAITQQTVQLLAIDELDLSQQNTVAPALTLYPEQLAYIIYTSGSTGKPKGVAIAHDGLSMHVQTIGKQYGMTPDDIELHFASISFDGAVERWTVPLAFGAKLIIRDQALWSAEKTCRVLQEEGVTIACFPPSYVAPLLDWIEATQPTLAVRSWTLGGEAFTRETYARLQTLVRPPRIINGYGPTETVVTPLIWRAYPGDSFPTAYAPIGEPVGSRRLYVLDEQLNPVPLGEAGELYIGDETGLARGYLHQPEQTSERFLPDPFTANGERMYRTGDLVRWRDDGVMEYLGRLDQQVKIRGFRIELGEIESRLQQLSGVETCLVALWQNQLIGYLHGRHATQCDQQALLAKLAQQVPDYMLPAQLMVLDHLPLTPAGKIDRQALPAPSHISLETYYTAPITPQETLLTTLWQELLGIEKVCRTSHFFALGGDSILCLQLVSKLKLSGFSLTPKDIFANPVLCDLAKTMTRVQQAQERALPQHAFGLMPIQAHFLAQDFAQPNHWNQHVCVTLKQKMDTNALNLALNALVEHHPSLRLAFSKTERGYQQAYQPFVSSNLLWQAQAADEAEFTDIAHRLQTSLNLASGKLLQAGLVTLSDTSKRLIVVIHHMAVDGVSWRILLDDLWTAYQQIVSDQAVVLPTNYASLDMAVAKLHEWRASVNYQQKQAYWQTVVDASHALLPTTPPARYADKHSLTISLSEQDTAALLTSTKDIISTLLAALPVASLTNNQTALPLYLEGHGREASVFGELDLSRLVGWMTSLYPMILHANQDSEAIEQQLSTIREDGGISFGARYLEPDQPSPNALLTFNYLGQYSHQDFAHWCQPFEGGGPAQSEQNTMLTPLVINTQIVSGRLSSTWEYATPHYHESDVQRFANQWRHQLHQHIKQLAQSPVPVQADQSLIERLNTDSKPPVFCIHPVTGRVVGYQKLAIALEGHRTVYGIQSQSFAYPGLFDRSFSHMADVYVATIRARQPQGPYSLIGWSLGGALCQEIAMRLEQEGESIEFIGLLDCYVPGTEIADDQWQSPHAKHKLISHLELLLGTLSDTQQASCLLKFDQSPPNHWPALFDEWLTENQFSLHDAQNARQVLYSWAVEQHMRALCSGYQLPSITTPVHTFWAGQPDKRASWLATELSKINSLADHRVYDTDHLGIVQHQAVINDLKQSLSQTTDRIRRHHKAVRASISEFIEH